jgi:hypothetical protein
MALTFDILAVASDQIYERRGRVQPIVGIRSEWFHHPRALCIPESVFINFSDAFRISCARFSYYGDTEYSGQEITRLCMELKNRPWAEKAKGRRARLETRAAIREVLAVAERALTNGQSLLVMGI